MVVEGPLTFQQFFDEMKKRFNIDITLVTSGKMSLFNAYLPNKKHEPRRQQEISEVYMSIAEDPVPDTRYYLCLELGGEVIGEGKDFSIPTVKYIFRKK